MNNWYDLKVSDQAVRAYADQFPNEPGWRKERITAFIRGAEKLGKPEKVQHANASATRAYHAMQDAAYEAGLKWRRKHE